MLTPSHLLCLHGSLSSRALWRPYKKRWGEASHVLAIDLLGYGSARKQTITPPFTLEAEASTVLKQLETLAPAQPVTILAHSYGASVALKFASLYPTRVVKLVLIEPVSFHLFNDEHWVKKSMQSLGEGVINALDQQQSHAAVKIFIDYWLGINAYESMDNVSKQLLASKVQKVRHDYLAILRETTLNYKLSNIAAPVTLIKGQDTRQEMAEIQEILLSNLPHGQQIIVPGNHFEVLHQPERLASHLKSALQ